MLTVILSKRYFMTDSRSKKIQHVLRNRQPDLTVVLENVEDPHNISAVLRSCDAVGIMEVYTIRTKDIRAWKFGNRSSSSASKWVMTHQHFSVESCMKAVKEKYDQVYSTHLGSRPISLYEIDFTRSTALVFGNERIGLSEEILSYCNGNFIIPQFGMISSLNISVACAVSIYEASRQKAQAGHYEEPKLQPEHLLELKNFWGLYEDLHIE